MSGRVSNFSTHPPGKKRARVEGSKPEGLTRDEYVKELKKEEETLSSESHPHTSRLLSAEIERYSKPESGKDSADYDYTAESAIDRLMELPWEKSIDENGIKCVLMPDEHLPNGKAKCTMKVFVPDNTPDGRQSATRGRLLGAGGTTLRQLGQESKCKVSLKGKGSMKFKDGSSEAAHMADPQYGHLHEDFHVLVEYEGNADGRNSAFRVADSLIRTVLSGGTIQISAFSDSAASSAVGKYGGSPGSQELAYAEQAVAAGQIVSVLAAHNEIGGSCKTSIKIFIPERTSLGCSRGKILGQKGMTLRQLQQECGCKMSIRGRASMKVPDGQNPEVLAATNPTYSHLKEPLHVLCEYEGPSQLRDATLQGAEALVRAALTPAGDPGSGNYQVSQYELMHQQYPTALLQTQQHLALPGLDAYGGLGGMGSSALVAQSGLGGAAGYGAYLGQPPYY